MSASILIRTRNEAAHLGQCLGRVFAQQGPELEVIVLDSGSTDGTLEIAAGFPVRLLRLRPEQFTYGYALNAGFAAARYPVLVALSGHSIPVHDRWLANLLRHFADPQVVGVSGPEVNAWAPPLPERRILLTPESFFADPRIGFANFNAAVRRAAWETLPFHETLVYGEDKEWAWRMVTEGHHVVVDTAAAVHHEHQETLGAIWRRSRRQALAQAAWRGPRRYRLTTAARLATMEAGRNLGRRRWDGPGLLGPFAYYLGRHAGFAAARRGVVGAGPRCLGRPWTLASPAGARP